MTGWRRKSSSIAQIRALAEKLGPTGKFPEGMLNEHDEGATRFAIYLDEGKVTLHFGKPTLWIGFNPQQAAELASVILKHAREAARETGETIEFRM